METKRALIIVDVQPTFCEGGALGVEGGNAVAERIADFVTSNESEYELIVTTQDWHIDPGTHFSDNPDFVDTWPPHGVAGTPEAELHEAIAALSVDAHVKKGEYAAAYSGFEGKDARERSLEEILRLGEIAVVDVVGIAESHCVKETAIDAVRSGWRVRVFSDLTVPVSEELGRAARVEMDEAGVELLASSEAFGFYEEDTTPDEYDDYEDPYGEEDFDSYEDFEDESYDEDDADDDNFDDGYGDDDFEDDDFEDSPVPDLAARLSAGISATSLVRTGDNSAEDFEDFEDFDLEEDLDFSDEVSEDDFDFSDIDFDPRNFGKN